MLKPEVRICTATRRAEWQTCDSCLRLEVDAVLFAVGLKLYHKSLPEASKLSFHQAGIASPGPGAGDRDCLWCDDLDCLWLRLDLAGKLQPVKCHKAPRETAPCWSRTSSTSSFPGSNRPEISGVQAHTPQGGFHMAKRRRCEKNWTPSRPRAAPEIAPRPMPTSSSYPSKPLLSRSRARSSAQPISSAAMKHWSEVSTARPKTFM